jgi:hypothetical protein
MRGVALLLFAALVLVVARRRCGVDWPAVDTWVSAAENGQGVGF